MSAQIEILLQIQDLDLMLREYGNEKNASAEAKLGFALGGIDTVRATREQLAGKINGDWLKLYERVAKKYPRAIVPMRDGICFGCFVRQPAKKSVESQDQDEVETCQRCGRILFRFRFPG